MRFQYLVVAACLFLYGCGHCPTPAMVPADISLFNGKDLDGWTWVSKDPAVGVDKVWSVVDGNLRCTGQPFGYLRTNTDYANYTLHVQLRHLNPGNTGIFVRITGPDKVFPKCMECQGMFNRVGDLIGSDDFGYQSDPARRNKKYTTRLNPRQPQKSLNEWNDVEITVNGSTMSVKVNGQLENSATELEASTGKIGLQSEGGQIEFRNIILTPLPDSKQP